MKDQTLDARLKIMRGQGRYYTFKKESVKVTQAEEFTFAPLFKNTRSSTNDWRIMKYCDPKRLAVATALMHILRPQRTTYVTAWQVEFIEHVVRGESIHWTKIFCYLVWINVSKRWRGASIKHITSFLVYFYHGMGLLTKSEEKRFPKESEVLELESDKDSEKDDDTQAKEEHEYRGEDNDIKSRSLAFGEEAIISGEE
ncbi:hypothetical protein AXG93_625s1170 [Marchantia polymorpha subsp. ruderalis]|uniref:Uncharacterized protein n=1 Tax=Marchantia polymorpha subsp. ruderalis TaxID=1480154 RepID=A0A176VC89_MARPO|nr:hypothetical protein AXG93_625s1170 [Marchantia polymorpha subsp. ruderalis]